MKKTTIIKILNIASVLILIPIAACMILLGKRGNEYHKEEVKVKELGKVVAGYTIEDVSEDVLERTSAGYSELTDIREVKKLNPDTFARLTANGTGIDYMVMASDDLDKYLHTDFDGNYSAYGMICVDPATNAESRNLVLYGHHMKNGSMFGALIDYLKEDYAKEHEEIRLITEDELRIYKVRAAVKFGPKDTALTQAMLFGTEADTKLIEERAAEAGTLYGALDWRKKYITLCTCEYTVKNGRLFVIGELTESYKLRKGE